MIRHKNHIIYIKHPFDFQKGFTSRSFHQSRVVARSNFHVISPKVNSKNRSCHKDYNKHSEMLDIYAASAHMRLVSITSQSDIVASVFIRKVKKKKCNKIFNSNQILFLSLHPSTFTIS